MLKKTPKQLYDKCKRIERQIKKQVIVLEEAKLKLLVLTSSLKKTLEEFDNLYSDADKSKNQI